MPLTETPEIAFSADVTSGSYAPSTLTGTPTESYTGGATCGEKVGKKATKAVKKGAFVGSAVSFECVRSRRGACGKWRARLEGGLVRFRQHQQRGGDGRTSTGGRVSRG